MTGTKHPVNKKTSGHGAIVEKLRVYPTSPIISKSDWQKIVDFYIAKAPATVIPAKTTTVVKTSIRQFFNQPVFIDNKENKKNQKKKTNNGTPQTHGPLKKFLI